MTVDIAAIVQEAVAAALAAAGVEDAPAPKKSSTRKSSKPATAASARKPARTAKPKPKVWTVKRSWVGVDPSPRMIGAALYYGCSAASVEGLDKHDLSKLIGKTRKVKVEVVD